VDIPRSGGTAKNRCSPSEVPFCVFGYPSPSNEQFSSIPFFFQLVQCLPYPFRPCPTFLRLFSNILYLFFFSTMTIGRPLMLKVLILTRFLGDVALGGGGTTFHFVPPQHTPPPHQTTLLPHPNPPPPPLILPPVLRNASVGSDRQECLRAWIFPFLYQSPLKPHTYPLPLSSYVFCLPSSGVERTSVSHLADPLSSLLLLRLVRLPPFTGGTPDPLFFQGQAVIRVPLRLVILFFFIFFFPTILDVLARLARPVAFDLLAPIFPVQDLPRCAAVLLSLYFISLHNLLGPGIRFSV